MARSARWRDRHDHRVRRRNGSGPQRPAAGLVAGRLGSAERCGLGGGCAVGRLVAAAGGSNAAYARDCKPRRGRSWTCPRWVSADLTCWLPCSTVLVLRLAGCRLSCWRARHATAHELRSPRLRPRPGLRPVRHRGCGVWGGRASAGQLHAAHPCGTVGLNLRGIRHEERERCTWLWSWHKEWPEPVTGGRHGGRRGRYDIRLPSRQSRHNHTARNGDEADKEQDEVALRPLQPPALDQCVFGHDLPFVCSDQLYHRCISAG